MEKHTSKNRIFEQFIIVSPFNDIFLQKYYLFTAAKVLNNKVIYL